MLLLFPNSEHFGITIIKFFGALGVDIFFVLSGFLIGGILLKQIDAKKTQPKDFGYFLVRRWFRTLPNYYLILVINCLLYYSLNGHLNVKVLRYFFFFQNFSNIQPDFFTESWSLSIEEFAYVIGPVTLLLLRYLWGKLNRYTFLWATIIIIILISLSRICFHYFNNENMSMNWSRTLRKVVIYRIDSIYYGFIIAFFALYKSTFWSKYKYVMCFMGSILFIIMHAFIFIKGLTPNVKSLFFNVFYLPLLSVSIALFFPVFTHWKHNRSPFLKPITTISLLSYSIYLINYSIIVLTLQYFIEVATLSYLSKGIVLVTFWITTFVLSYILYNYFEKPLIGLRDSYIVKRFFKYN